jgi:hypothetical protein
MGREAECTCNWNGTRAKVKALIEPPELILRGGIRHRIPFAEMKNIRAEDDNLHFHYRGETVALTLGLDLAARWIKYLTAPPPSLVKKLGITADTIVRLIGPADDPALVEALSSASTQTGAPHLILARVDTPAELTRALKSAADQLDHGVPIWFIYPKGQGPRERVLVRGVEGKDQPLTENDVRSTALAAGIVDTKVCAVSPALTGLRFVKRKSPSARR